jgi:AmiR/NasT family two-component response regulator
MLNDEEKRRLGSCIDTIRAVVSGQLDDGLTPETQLWLALKLKEINIALERKYLEQKSNRPNESNIIGEAKKLMMAKYRISEQEAHDFIRKTAMSAKTTKFQIAKRFLESETK